ncbi:hypothetical protein MJG53_012287 [Ovis ammon polii x Ovis aries]|nr:hypothetical protein MJT46_011911 [Ovis ammon polii x Ovis aries]KAI4574111.1 hypothetical protein MJG53_012287 [Ovis ammon polii x Ovis aries]
MTYSDRSHGLYNEMRETTTTKLLFFVEKVIDTVVFTSKIWGLVKPQCPGYRGENPHTPIPLSDSRTRFQDATKLARPKVPLRPTYAACPAAAASEAQKSTVPPSWPRTRSRSPATPAAVVGSRWAGPPAQHRRNPAGTGRGSVFQINGWGQRLSVRGGRCFSESLSSRLGLVVIMARGNQRELARQKNMKKSQEISKGKRKEDSLTTSQRKQRDSEIMQQKQKAANERKSMQTKEK